MKQSSKPKVSLHQKDIFLKDKKSDTLTLGGISYIFDLTRRKRYVDKTSKRSNFRIPRHSEPTLFSLIRCESVFITMYPYRDAGQSSDASHRVFLLRHCSWIYPYHDAGQFSDASQRFFVLRHHSWMYPYRDAGQFSDAHIGHPVSSFLSDFCSFMPPCLEDFLDMFS